MAETVELYYKGAVKVRVSADKAATLGPDFRKTKARKAAKPAPADEPGDKPGTDTEG